MKKIFAALVGLALMTACVTADAREPRDIFKRVTSSQKGSREQLVTAFTIVAAGATVNVEVESHSAISRAYLVIRAFGETAAADLTVTFLTQSHSPGPSLVPFCNWTADITANGNYIYGVGLSSGGNVLTDTCGNPLPDKWVLNIVNAGTGNMDVDVAIQYLSP